MVKNDFYVDIWYNVYVIEWGFPTCHPWAAATREAVLCGPRNQVYKNSMVLKFQFVAFVIMVNINLKM